MAWKNSKTIDNYKKKCNTKALLNFVKYVKLSKKAGYSDFNFSIIDSKSYILQNIRLELLYD